MNAIYEALIKAVPDYQSFLTVDEMDRDTLALAEAYPDVVTVVEIGKTRNRHPIYGLKIGNGSRNALMFGCPHPNEPIGAMMLTYFSEALAKQPALREALDYTFYIVKAWDADGTRLNEQWFKGPFTLYNYARHFFRPAGHQQVEWTFPVTYKQLNFTAPLPETKAMMDWMDEIKPTLIYSLHNAGFGGVYWYISEDIPEVYGEMKAAAEKHGVPLSLGEAEAPYCVPYAPAIFQDTGIEQEYDYLEKYGVKNPETVIRVGNCSAAYGKTCCNAFSLLTELPYFYDKRISDLSPSDQTRGETALQRIEEGDAGDRDLKEKLKSLSHAVPVDNPFRVALEAFTDTEAVYAAQRQMIFEDPAYRKPATVAEAFDNLLVSRFYRSLSLGMLVRMCESTLEDLLSDGRQDDPAVRQLQSVKDSGEQQLEALCNELEREMDYEVVPIRKLVSIQLECGLLVAEHLKTARGGDGCS